MQKYAEQNVATVMSGAALSFCEAVCLLIDLVDRR